MLTLVPTVGGGESLKATPFSFFFFKYFIKMIFSGHLFISVPVLLPLRNISCETEILNDKRGVVDNSKCLKMCILNCQSQN